MEKAMAPHSSTLAWKIPWTEEPGRLESMGSRRVRHDWATSLSLFHFPALEKEMATHSSVLAWRIPGTAESGGLLSMGLHRVGHDWSDLAAAAATLGESFLVPIPSQHPLFSFCLHLRCCAFLYQLFKIENLSTVLPLYSSLLTLLYIMSKKHWMGPSQGLRLKWEIRGRACTWKPSTAHPASAENATQKFVLDINTIFMFAYGMNMQLK